MSADDDRYTPVGRFCELVTGGKVGLRRFVFDVDVDHAAARLLVFYPRSRDIGRESLRTSIRIHILMDGPEAADLIETIAEDLCLIEHEGPPA